MIKTITTDSDAAAGELADAAIPASAMHHPKHCVLDTLETAALDELQHEAALRDSALRPPR